MAREDTAAAESALRGLGYGKSREDEVRLERGSVAVHLLPIGGRRSRGGGFELTIDRLAGEAAHLRGTTLRVATCAELLVLKAVAWSDRHRERDLADIGTLALIDQFEGGIARPALEDGLDGRLHRERRRDVQRVSAKFSRPQDQGPLAFVKEVVRPHADPSLLARRDDWEQVVAGIISDAVKTVLSGVH